ncbi:MAG TPA: TetR/AcrR family transcriptional regulator [Lentimicrobium sp.]|nr:TetR/AcrR family transcriptional regulator [Lentimicrobium sp.]
MEKVEEIAQNRHYLNLLNTARELFWKYGFKRVSIEEICSKAGTSKMTFYRFFSNKIEIAKAVYEREISRSQIAFRNLLEATDLTTAEKIRKMIQMKVDGTHDVSPEFLQDFYTNPDIGLKEYIETETWKVWNTVIDDFRKAQDKGIFRKDFKPEVFFRMAQQVLPLLNDKSITGLYNSPAELIIDVTNLMVYGIIPHD